MQEINHPSDLDPNEVFDDARSFIAQARWTYARTVPEHPHEYCLREWLVPELQADFDAFVALIARHGYPGRFWNQRWTYLDIDDHKYWQSTTLDGSGGLIVNRARLDLDEGKEVS